MICGGSYRGRLKDFGRLLEFCTAVSSEAWAKLRDWASVADRGRLLLSGSVVLASLKAPVPGSSEKRLTGQGGKLNTSQADPVAANSKHGCRSISLYFL